MAPTATPAAVPIAAPPSVLCSLELMFEQALSAIAAAITTGMIIFCDICFSCRVSESSTLAREGFRGVAEQGIDRPVIGHIGPCLEPGDKTVGDLRTRD